MTIVIKKGSDAQRKKRLKLRAASRGQNEGSDEEHDDAKSSATDMTDVLDFKVYRIIKPNFYNNSTRVNLIGENFYRDEDQAKIEDLVSHNSNAEVEQHDDLTVLERMQDMQHQNSNVVRVRKTELLNRILESEKEVRALKSGHSIGKYLVPPTLDETVQWAIKFVAVQQEVLVLNIINTYHDMKKYDASVERMAKQRKKRSASEQDGRSRATSEDTVNRERTSSDDYLHTGRDRTASTMSDSDTGGGGGGGRDRTVSGVSDASWDLPATDKRRSSSRLLSVGANDTALAAAGDKLQATQQATGRTKHVSLAQQLEQIKSQGTDAFLKCIVPQKEPIFPAGKRTWKVQSAHQSPQKAVGDGSGQRESTGSLGNLAETSKAQPPTTSKTGGSETPRNAHLAKHSSGAASAKSGKDVAMLHSGVLAALPEEPTASEGSRGAVPVTVRAGSAGDGNGKRVQSPPAVHGTTGNHQPSARKSQKHHEAGEEQNQAADHSTGTHQPRPPSGSKPSHRDAKPAHGTLRAASPTHTLGASATRPAEGTSSKHPHAEPKPTAIEQAVLNSQRILSALLKKTEAMQSRISRKIRRAEHAGMRLLEQNHEFNNAVEEAGEKAISMFEEREFTRPIALLHQVSSFEEGAELKTPSMKIKKGLKNDLHNMHVGADKKTFELYMSRLVKHRWFVTAVLKLRDHMKKMNNAVPECCLKMIVAVEQVLLMGYSLTEAVFYQILEGVVTVKEDHQKTIVHQLLKILRDALPISAGDFLQYLEDRDINPHPELSNQVRLQAKVQSKKNITASLSVRTTLARLTQMSVSTPSNAKVAFMVPSDGITAGTESSATAGVSASESAPVTSTVTFSARGAGRNTILAVGQNKNQGPGSESPRLAGSEAVQDTVSPTTDKLASSALQEQFAAPAVRQLQGFVLSVSSK